MDKLGKIIPAMIGALLGITMVMAVAQYAMAAQTPYECPICHQRFATYDELYQHFVTEHPGEPIEILWT